MCVCMLQFSMHANLIHVNTTVGVPTLPTGFNADAMTTIQEGRALVGVIIIVIIGIIIIITILVISVCGTNENLLINGNMNMYLSKIRNSRFVNPPFLFLIRYHYYVMNKEIIHILSKIQLIVQT